MKVGQILQRARTKKEAVFMSYCECWECECFKGDERGQFRCVDPDEKAECRERFKEYWDYLPWDDPKKGRV